jgi:hypothetical protein
MVISSSHSHCNADRTQRCANWKNPVLHGSPVQGVCAAHCDRTFREQQSGVYGDVLGISTELKCGTQCKQWVRDIAIRERFLYLFKVRFTRRGGLSPVNVIHWTGSQCGNTDNIVSELPSFSALVLLSFVSFPGH